MKDEIVPFKLVVDFFGGNRRKSWLWFKTKNILLGGLSPADMVMAGRERKLEKFIRDSLETEAVKVGRSLGKKGSIEHLIEHLWNIMNLPKKK